MSYSLTITGHTANEHNAKVKEVAEEAWAKLKALHRQDEPAPTLSGYSGDQTGSITLATPTEPGGIAQEPQGDEKTPSEGEQSA